MKLLLKFAVLKGDYMIPKLSDEKFYVLLAFTKISSDSTLGAALFDYFVTGLTQAECADKNNYDRSNFNKRLDKFLVVYENAEKYAKLN